MASPKLHLEILPSEMLCSILSYLPDIESLDNLIQVSPAAFRAFSNGTVSAMIFEAVLSSGATHTYSCALIRVVTLIRADAFPDTVTDFMTFKNLIVHETTPHTYEPPHWEHPPIRLPGDISPSILRGILATNRKVQRLTFGCLDFYLARFLELKPYHPAGFFCDGKPWIDIEEQDDFLGPWKEKVHNSKFYYPVQSTGPPSWLEQQRVYRLFWRRQLSDDLKAVIHDSDRTTWPVFKEIEEEEEEEEMTEEEKREWEEFEMAMDVERGLCMAEEEEGQEEEPDESKEEINQRKWNYRLSQIEPGGLVRVPEYSVEQRRAGDMLRHRATTLEEELLKTVIQYTWEMPEIISEERYLALKTEYAEGPASGNIDSRDHFRLTNSHVSVMWEFFYYLAGEHYGYNFNSITPLQHVDFAIFRRLGFAIWNDVRMIAYGLLLPTEDSCVGMFRSYMEAWKSLLTEEERAIVDKEIAKRVSMLSSCSSKKARDGEGSSCSVGG